MAMSHARCRQHGDGVVDDLPPRCFHFHADSIGGFCFACWCSEICQIPLYALLFVALVGPPFHSCGLSLKHCVNVLQRGAGGSICLLLDVAACQALLPCFQRYPSISV